MSTHEPASNRAVAILIGCIAQTLHQSDPTFAERLRKNLDKAHHPQHGGTAENKLIYQFQTLLDDKSLFPKK